MISHAEHAVSSYLRMGYDAFDNDHTISHFTEIHKRSKGEVEFILAFGPNDGRLVQVKEGCVEEVDTAWIGDPRAFSLYQRAFHEGLSYSFPSTAALAAHEHSPHPDADHDLLVRMCDAMVYVLMSSEVQSTGGLLNAVHTHSDCLCYASNLRSHTGHIDLKLPMQEDRAYMGRAEVGDYSVYLFNVIAGMTLLPAYYLWEGRLGVLFVPKTNGLLSVIGVRECSQDEFVRFINEHTAYEVQPRLMGEELIRQKTNEMLPEIIDRLRGKSSDPGIG